MSLWPDLIFELLHFHFGEKYENFCFEHMPGAVAMATPRELKNILYPIYIRDSRSSRFGGLKELAEKLAARRIEAEKNELPRR